MTVTAEGNIIARTHAYNHNRLLKEILEMSDEENAIYLRRILYDHSYRWARKQYSMSDRNAGKYAAWFVETFGDEWVTDVTAPSHSGWTIFRFARYTNARALAHEGT